MPAEGMVDALRRARQLARPTGCVVDLHPTAARATLFIGDRAAGVVEAGDAPARHQAASDAIEHVVTAGLYAVERALEFEHHLYADTLDELQEHIVEDWRDARIDDETMARARRWIAEAPDARIYVRERVRVTRLRPLHTV